MSLFGKAKTIYTSASISDNMLILTQRTRTNASHSESRVMIDKISSITHSVVFGKKSVLLSFIGIVLMVVGVILMAAAQLITPGVIGTVLGVLLIILAFILREHSIVVDCSGDFHDICVGRKNTDQFYERVCAVLKMQREGEAVVDMKLTEDNE